MQKDVRPRVFISECLGFRPCRYDGAQLKDAFVTALRPHVEVVTTCPEERIGMGTPRDPIRVVEGDGGLQLLQPKTGADFAPQMTAYAAEFLAGLGEVDGFILKSRSPSCAIKDAKVFPSPEKGGHAGRGAGFFGQAVLERYPAAAIEDDGRLHDLGIRENFLSKLFSLARFREAKAEGTMGALVQFHTRHKLLLMAFHEVQMRELGRLVANTDKRPVPELFEEYGAGLAKALAGRARYTRIINVLDHAFGYFSKTLTSREKRYYEKLREDYRSGSATLSMVTSLLHSWIIRFEQAYLADQLFFAPFPEELVSLKDSGKGRVR